jgi:membrane associated rhomboid family serine protease
MSDVAVEIFRAPRRAVCDERAFMLAAVGIACVVAADGAEFVLLADAADVPAALDHLRKYEVESRARPAAPPPPARLHPGAWLGSLVYALVLIGVTLAISNGWWRLDAFEAGTLDAGRVQAGQWWRVWTALTLHLDGAHLAANTAAGMWFGYLAGRLVGTGNAWLLIVAGAGFANWIEASLGPVTHRSVGASTAVFTALGLLSAYSWRTRFSYPQRWASRWGPLIAGVILLSWTGTGAESVNGESGGGQTVDVVAHALGFAVGAGLGAVAAVPTVSRMLARVPQWLVGLAALAPLAAAWVRALAS